MKDICIIYFSCLFNNIQVFPLRKPWGVLYWLRPDGPWVFLYISPFSMVCGVSYQQSVGAGPMAVDEGHKKGSLGLQWGDKRALKPNSWTYNFAISLCSGHNLETFVPITSKNSASVEGSSSQNCSWSQDMVAYEEFKGLFHLQLCKHILMTNCIEDWLLHF